MPVRATIVINTIDNAGTEYSINLSSPLYFVPI
jgi:hypothetical protein